MAKKGRRGPRERARRGKRTFRPRLHRSTLPLLNKLRRSLPPTPSLSALPAPPPPSKKGTERVGSLRPASDSCLEDRKAEEGVPAKTISSGDEASLSDSVVTWIRTRRISDWTHVGCRETLNSDSCAKRKIRSHAHAPTRNEDCLLGHDGHFFLSLRRVPRGASWNE